MDWEVLACLTRNNPDKIRRFATLFYASITTSLTDLAQALAQNDHAALGDLGHRLKSPARSMGAFEVGDLCEMLEQAGKRGDLAGARQLVGAVQAALAAAQKSIAARYPETASQSAAA